VVGRQIGPGQYLQAGASTPVYTVADLSSVWLLAEVPEVDAGLVRVGQRVTAQVTGLPGRVFTARLSYVAAAVDPTTRRVAVHAVLDNRDGALKPQMFAALTIVTSADSLVPAVPEQAVIYEGAQTRVWILEGANTAALRRIAVGRTLDGMIEVLGGLQVGQQVFTRGALFVDRAASGD
jgi:cobalt-zinc-cadmium efflux system membrane fusion protein